MVFYIWIIARKCQFTTGSLSEFGETTFDTLVGIFSFIFAVWVFLLFTASRDVVNWWTFSKT